MKVSEIKEIAKTMGIKNISKMKKADLIHSIQVQEGNSDCYGSPWRLECSVDDCSWRRDCQSE